MHAAAGEQPGAGEVVIGRKRRENLSQSSSTASTWQFVRALEVALELQDCTGVCEDQIDAKPPASFDISATQSPTTMRLLGTDSNLVRGALADAPRRDTTMTQITLDSGDAVGVRGTKQPTGGALTGKVKIDLIEIVVARDRSIFDAHLPVSGHTSRRTISLGFSRRPKAHC